MIARHRWRILHCRYELAIDLAVQPILRGYRLVELRQIKRSWKCDINPH
jgi:hypothetical protein